MKNFSKLLIQACVIAILGLGLFKSYGLYKQNLLGRIPTKNTALINERPFTILIPAHNPGTSSEKSLQSVLNQNYTNFRVFYIDNGSTDDSLKRVETFINLSERKNKVTLIQNSSTTKTLDDIYNTIQRCNDLEIILVIRSGDFLAHEDVLFKINTLYVNPHTWMTYGSFLNYPTYKQTPTQCKEFSKSTITNNSYRSMDPPLIYPITFYAGLFKKITKESLLYENESLQMHSAWPFALPLLEMSGRHARFISETLYLYNQNIPLDHFSKSLNNVKTLPKYQRIKSLDFGSEKL